MIGPAWEHIVVERATAVLQPSQHARPRRFEQLELDGPARLLLHHHRTRPDTATADEVTDALFTTSQPRSLLSMARSNSARSRSRRSRSSQKRIAQTCVASVPSSRRVPPAFQARRSREAGSYSECPIIVLLSALVGQRELRWMQWRLSLAETGQPLWSTRRQQADVRSGALPTAAIDPNGTLQCFSARGSRRRRTATAQIVD